MATATAHGPPAIQPGLNTSLNAGANLNVAGLGSDQVASNVPSRAEIQEPSLLNQADYQHILSLSKDAKEADFWRSQYKKAFEAQKKQTAAWSKIRVALQPDEDGNSQVSENNVGQFKKLFVEYQDIGTKELSTINRDIQKHLGDDEMMGCVRKFPPLKPCLVLPMRTTGTRCRAIGYIPINSQASMPGLVLCNGFVINGWRIWTAMMKPEITWSS